MIELVNFSNTAGDLHYLLGDERERLDRLLQQHSLDGVEMMFAGPWDGCFPQKKLIQGVHLRFWPDWIDFWRGNQDMLQRTFGSKNAIAQEYGCADRQEWVQMVRRNVRTAVQCGAPYFVFHVTNMRPWELVRRNFAITDKEVVDTAIELINLIADEIPEDRLLLFENLWWAGLTLRNTELAAYLLSRVRHDNCGFMLDTGHLMVTNTDLASEDAGISFILDTIDGLGKLASLIKGIHLHCSLSGSYAKRCRQRKDRITTMGQALSYTLHSDCHQPYKTPGVRTIIDRLQPTYVVHEFVPENYRDWDEKIRVQRHALGWE